MCTISTLCIRQQLRTAIHTIHTNTEQDLTSIQNDNLTTNYLKVAYNTFID